jgi:hypothetical protein
VLCEATVFGPAGTSTCVVCEAGKYENVATHMCEACPMYSHSPAASTSITECICNAGYSGGNGQTCEVCEAGKYENQAAHTCETCPTYADSPAGSAAITECICNAGYTGPAGGPCQAQVCAPVYDYYVAPADPPVPAAACTTDCPSQPSACTGTVSSSTITFPCATGCAEGPLPNSNYEYVLTCRQETCCQARYQAPPANGQHKLVGSGDWTSSSLTVFGGMYTEVRCNIGYTLSGRNIGFSGNWIMGKQLRISRCPK